MTNAEEEGHSMNAVDTNEEAPKMDWMTKLPKIAGVVSVLALAAVFIRGADSMAKNKHVSNAKAMGSRVGLQCLIATTAVGAFIYAGYGLSPHGMREKLFRNRAQEIQKQLQVEKE